MSQGKAKDEAVMEAVEGLPACCKRIAGTIASCERLTVAARIVAGVSDVLLIAASALFFSHVPGLSILALASIIGGLAVPAVIAAVVKVRRNRLPREEMAAVDELMRDGWTPKTVSSLARVHMPWWMRSRAGLTLEADRLAGRRGSTMRGYSRCKPLAKRREGEMSARSADGLAGEAKRSKSFADEYEIFTDELFGYDGLDDWPYDGSWAYGEDPHHGLDAERVMRDQGSHSGFVASLMDVDGWYGETAGSPLPAECRAAAQEAIRLIAQLPRTGSDDAQPSEEKMADVEALLDAMTTIGGKPFSEACKAAWDEAKREAEAKRSQAADAGVREALAKAKVHLEWLASPEASTLRDGVSRLDEMASDGLTTGKEPSAIYTVTTDGGGS